VDSFITDISGECIDKENLVKKKSFSAQQNRRAAAKA
jgi:hypothetical protein